MKTAGLIKISPSKSAQTLIDYDTQEHKTSGEWQGQYGYDTSDLVSFKGTANVAGSVSDKRRAFVRDAYANVKAHLMENKLNRADYEGLTLVQSYDYRANPNLTPTQVHRMGVDLYGRVQTYLKDRYGYDLDCGAISTHIDDDVVKHHDKRKTHRNTFPHLHNHIAVPYFNGQGQPIYKYLRKADLYRLQSINDSITQDNGLNDYYFAKLLHDRQPLSTYTIKRHRRHPKQRSNVELSWGCFKRANDYGWDRGHGNYNRAKPLRDAYLHFKYGYQTKQVADKKNHKKHTVFTLNVFNNNSKHQQWYNLVNMQALRWRDKKEAKAERLLWQFDFHKLTDKSTSFQSYQDTIRYAGRHLPNTKAIDTPKLRDRFKIGLYGCYQKVQASYKRTSKAFHERVVSPLDRKFSDGMMACKQSFLSIGRKLRSGRRKTGSWGRNLQDGILSLVKQGRARERTSRQRELKAKQSRKQSKEHVRARTPKRKPARHRSHGVERTM